MTDTTNTLSNARALADMIERGEILEAVDRFYADNAQMQENANAPTVGKDAIVTHEKAFLSTVKEWKRTEFKAIAAEGDVAFLEYAFDFVNTDGQLVRYEQISAQRWKDGQIVHERFYYDASGS